MINILLLIVSVIGAPTLISQSFHGNNFDNVDGWTVVNAQPTFSICSQTKILGGHDIFGTRSTIFKLFDLPPHHTIYLRFQFWKIDLWDNQELHVWMDDQVLLQRKYNFSSGRRICGHNSVYNEEVTNIDLTALHTGPTVLILFTTSLTDSPMIHSWGFREFQMSIERCPDGCHSCAKGDSSEQCLVWEVVKSSWTGPIPSRIQKEGWVVVGGKTESSLCSSIALFGGFERLGQGSVVKTTQQLPPHYKLKLKGLIAKIDNWENESVYINVQDTHVYTRAFQANQGYFGRLCGGVNPDWRELMVRIEVDIEHQGTSVNIEMYTNLNEATNNKSVGFRDFYIFVAKCALNCGECVGPRQFDCKQCIRNYYMLDGQCIPLNSFVILEKAFLEEKFIGVNDWIVQNNKGKKLASECQIQMVGGLEIFGKGASAEKSFIVPPHKRIRIMLTIYKLEDWFGEWMFVRVDGMDIWKRQWTTQTGGYNLCGHAGYGDSIEKLDEIFAHKDTKLHLYLSSTLNDYSKNESWGFRDFKLFYEPKEQCAIFYTECNYKGQSYEFCSQSPNFPQEHIPKIRSIKIPPQGRVTLYDNKEYSGKKVVYTKDQPCIESFQYSSLLQYHQTTEWVQLNIE